MSSLRLRGNAFRILVYMAIYFRLSEAIVLKKYRDKDKEFGYDDEDDGKFAAKISMNNTFAEFLAKSEETAAEGLERVPQDLKPVEFLLGRWRSEFGGKAFFPTMPTFTYGEQLDFRLCGDHTSTLPSINYTAFAWDNSDLRELHSENGFISVAKASGRITMNTAMSNGFVTVEEGVREGNTISLSLKKIGRLDFSRDMPVRQTLRTWRLLDPTHLEARLWMRTYTHRLRPHAFIVYEKVQS